MMLVSTTIAEPATSVSATTATTVAKPATTQAKPSNSVGISTVIGSAVGGAVGGGLLVALLCLCLFVIFKKKCVGPRKLHTDTMLSIIFLLSCAEDI